MVLGWLKRDEAGPGREPDSSSAWQRIARTQEKPRMPCLLIPQPAHAVLAGELAGALLPEVFGALPQEIRQAILMHDTGWAMIDAEQILRLRSTSGGDAPVSPISFISASPQETVEVWTASIGRVARLSAAGALVVSRHFTYLAQRGNSAYEKFVTVEQGRQRSLQAAAETAPGDLSRWTAALGFCDLVSLYLITGLQGGVLFPLAHPSSPEAQSAPRVELQVEARNLRFTPALWPAGFTAEIEALKHPIGSGGVRTERLEWNVV